MDSHNSVIDSNPVSVRQAECTVSDRLDILLSALSSLKSNNACREVILKYVTMWITLFKDDLKRKNQ